MKLLRKYAPKDRPLLLGMGISLMGSLPLGYINVISLQVLTEQGKWASLFFIAGIITIQFFVLNFVSKMALWLVNQKKLLTAIDLFTFVFLLFVGIYFLTDTINNNKSSTLSDFKLAQYPFFLAVFLNGLNFIQWPYWAGIYSYLFRSEILLKTKKSNTRFIFGAVLGTTLGMLFFAHVGNFILMSSKINLSNFMNLFFSVLFLTLALVKAIKITVKLNFTSNRRVV
ncbi:hypothetical protein [Flavobacterium tegetincola]|uniref:hypothetical protein n=1 Tax=Flavobacterium tegetincola TaxID=150172 RepID=UPI0004024126|nr:hypothetical protein [Flavobacterium tegetincola]